MNIYEQAKVTLDTFLNTEKPIIDLENMNSAETAVIVVDMINGFAKSGSLYSERVKKIIGENRVVLESTSKAHHVFLCDSHKETASEFNVFPVHCVSGTEETEVVEELNIFASQGTVIYKNSTNGFLEPEFMTWLQDKQLKNIIIIGCCTDLCVLQFATTLKTHFNRLNLLSNIYVPLEAVETYEISDIHPGDFMHIMALKFMQDMGIVIGRLK